MDEEKNVLNLKDIRVSHHGKVINVRGIIKNIGEVNPRITNAVFKCSRCETPIEVQQNVFGSMIYPGSCSKEQGGCGRKTPSTKFTLCAKDSSFIDHQKIFIYEENDKKIDLELILEGDDISEGIEIGELLNVEGELFYKETRKRGRNRLVFDKFMIVNKIISHEPLDQLTRSKTPSQRASVFTILRVIRELQEEVEDYGRTGVPVEEIIRQCEEENITKDVVLITLAKSNQIGDISKTGANKYKIYS